MHVFMMARRMIPKHGMVLHSNGIEAYTKGSIIFSWSTFLNRSITPANADFDSSQIVGVFVASQLGHYAVKANKVRLLCSSHVNLQHHDLRYLLRSSIRTTHEFIQMGSRTSKQI
jgi:hypothetical protein